MWNLISLVGLGVGYDITERGMELLRECDVAFCERHTMPVPEEYIKTLEEKSGKRIETIGREDVEGEDPLVLKEAKERSVCLLCGGEPLAATTHISLLVDARKAGIGTEVVHNSSVFSAAAGKSGLQQYKFGKTVTVSFWRKNYEPTSPLLLIEKNIGGGMHTLVLMDLDAELGLMDAKLGLGLLRKMEEKEGRKVLPEKVVVLSRLGYPDEKISYGKISELVEGELGEAPFCIVVPGELHEMEREYLELL
ncbi:diphthine synthase [Candidatus Micrarchaeota archaeon]|nr:diphthine synthase [Candidatus Micrarchaeota archaeon]MBD3417989.1 diphthine synthase [Candidatus Micrarchaeota archaeon]